MSLAGLPTLGRLEKGKDAVGTTDPRRGFDTILADSLKLNAQIEQSMPRIKLGVDQIDEASRKLVKSARVADSSNTKAHYLFAVRGFDADKLSRDLADINLKASFDPLEPLADTDVAAFLEHRHDMIVLSAIEEAKKETVRQFNQVYHKALSAEWQVKKAEVLEEYGQHAGEWAEAELTLEPASPAASAVGRSGGSGLGASSLSRTPGSALMRSGLGSAALQSPFAMSPIAPGRRGRTALTPKQMKYSAATTKCNEARAKGRPFPLITAYLDAGNNTDERTARKLEIANSWKALQCMLGEQGVLGLEFQREVLTEGAYEADYATNSLPLRRMMVAGARTFLERQYAELLEEYVSADRAAGARGGRPGLFNTVKAFLDVKFQRSAGKAWPKSFEERVDDYPVWPLVYYCLRCGDLDGALSVLSRAGGIVGDMPIFFEAYARNPDDALDDVTWAQLSKEFNQRVRVGCRDPYKQAVYTIVGRFDTARPQQDIFCTTQDFMWLKLCMIQEHEDNSAVDVLHAHYRLSDLQAMLTDYGPAHFNPDGSNPLLYFQVLVLSQQFERAIEYLRGFEDYQVETVHVACALSYYGVMRLPVREDSELVGSSGGLLTFNFMKMVSQYTRQFSPTDFRVALQYLYLISRPEARFASIRALLMTTREFDVMLGSVQPDGLIKPGCIHSFMSAEEVRRLSDLCATSCADDGRYDDAIALYSLAGNHDRVLALLIKELSQSLATPSQEREGKIALAAKIRGRMESTGAVGNLRDPSLFATFSLLQELMEFFDLERSGRYGDALALMDSLALLPDERPATASARVDAFRLLDDAVRRNFSAVLLSTMTILYKLYVAAKDSPSVAGNREAYLSVLRARARALITFSGMIQFRMPGDTNAKLLRMEVFMN